MKETHTERIVAPAVTIKLFLKALKNSGYTGPIGLQGYGIGGDAYDNLKRSMSAWRKLSEKLAAKEK